MPQPTVLVGFAEALAAPEVVWSLVDSGFRVVAFARRGRASALRFSRHVACHDITAPESNFQATLSELHSLMNSLRAETGAEAPSPILFPLDDKAVWLCNKLPLEEGWIHAGPRGALADLALDKKLQVEAAREAGFNVPRSALVRTANDLLEFSEAESYPIILKAADAVPVFEGRLYSCRKWICANPIELRRAIVEWGERVPLLAQTFVTGVGEGVFGLAAPEGIRAWSGHRRIRMMNPEGSGSSACESQPVTPDVKSAAEKFVKDSGWNGLFMIELLRDNSGKIWFVELNGRPWGSMALGRRQGLEYPAWHVQLAMDNRSPAGLEFPPSSGLICRHAGREFMHLLFVMRGAKSNAQKEWPSLWKSVRNIFQFHREEGLYNWRRDDPKVFFADFYYTVRDNLFKSRN